MTRQEEHIMAMRFFELAQKVKGQSAASDPYNRQWLIGGKTYDTAQSKVLGTRILSGFDPDIDDEIMLIETLYQEKGGDYFTHTVITTKNGKLKHSMHLRSEKAANRWLEHHRNERQERPAN
jgi:hypothetical protein